MSVLLFVSERIFFFLVQSVGKPLSLCIVGFRKEQLCKLMARLRKYLVVGRWDVEKEDKHEKGTEPVLLPFFSPKIFAFQNENLPVVSCPHQ